jgi:hypothetical protein
MGKAELKIYPSGTYPPYLLTPQSRVLLEKLTVNFAVSQEIPRIFGTRMSLTVPTSAYLWVILNACFLRRGVVSTSPNPQARGPSLVGYAWLHILQKTHDNIAKF